MRARNVERWASRVLRGRARNAQRTTHNAQRASQAGAALLTAMLTVTLVATFAAAAMWQQWRAIEVETAERGRIQSAWILVGALDWSRLILREDSLAQGGDGTDNLSEPWAVPLQEARLSTFLAANRNVAQVEDASTDTADAFLSGQITDQQGLLNLRNLAGDKQVDATAQRQFARLFDYLGLPRQQLDQLAAPFFLLFLGAAFAGLARVGLGQYGQLLAHLGHQLGLLLQHLIHLALGFLQVVANGGQGRVGQGAGGAALGRLAPAGQRGLGDGLGLVRAFAGLGVDQDDFERRVLEHAVEALRVDEAHREQQRVQGDRYAQRDLQRGEAQEEGGDFHRRAAPR